LKTARLTVDSERQSGNIADGIDAVTGAIARIVSGKLHVSLNDISPPFEIPVTKTRSESIGCVIETVWGWLSIAFLKSFARIVCICRPFKYAVAEGGALFWAFALFPSGFRQMQIKTVID
jgi:hypothetical protein